MGETAKGLSWCRRAKTSQQKLIRENIRRRESKSALGSVWSLEENIHRKLGDQNSSLSCYQQAAELFSGLHRDYPDLEIYAYKTARMYRLIGKYHHRDDPQSRRAAFKESVDLYHRALKDRPNNVRWRKILADCYDELGELWQEDGQPEKALRCFQQARRQLKKVVEGGRDHPENRTVLSEIVAHIESAHARLPD